MPHINIFFRSFFIGQHSLALKWSFYGICIAFFLSVLGQFTRIEISSGAIIGLDIFLPILTAIWAWERKKQDKAIFSSFTASPLFFPLLGFLVVGFFSLFWNAIEMPVKEFFKSGFYLFRYFFLLVFIFIVADVLSVSKKRQYLFLITLFFSAVLLAILGFLQLHFVPDFRFMHKHGWDPHIGRILSTWFDPNFLGGMFGFLLAIWTGIFLLILKKHPFKYPWFQSSIGDWFKKLVNKNPFYFSVRSVIFFTVFLLIFTALILTFSRSAFLAFAIPSFLFGIFFMRKLLLVAILLFIFLIPFSDRAKDRLISGFDSIVSVAEENPLFFPDATARLRVINFQEGIMLSQQNFYIGVGFNTLRSERGGTEHARGGFDSSLLTVFATTGIIGFGFFLYFLFSVLRLSVRTYYEKEKTDLKRYISLGFFFGVFGVLAHSIFVNSLFFSFFMIYFFGILGYILSDDKKT